MTSNEKIYEGARLCMEGLGEIIQDFAEQFSKALKSISESLNPFLKKKISKKKFCKLLQAHGIQRNEINRIIHNNKEPYTYGRLYYLIGGTNEIK